MLIESFHLSGHNFRFHWTVKNLEVFLIYTYVIHIGLLVWLLPEGAFWFQVGLSRWMLHCTVWPFNIAKQLSGAVCMNFFEPSMKCLLFSWLRKMLCLWNFTGHVNNLCKANVLVKALLLGWEEWDFPRIYSLIADRQCTGNVLHKKLMSCWSSKYGRTVCANSSKEKPCFIISEMFAISLHNFSQH